MTKALIKPKKCPFCGSDNLLVIPISDWEPSPIAVLCENCGSQGPSEKTKDLAIIRWNRRDKVRVKWMRSD